MMTQTFINNHLLQPHDVYKQWGTISNYNVDFDLKKDC